MVPLAQVIESNEKISSTFPPGLVAVFVGGTSGVGEYTVKAFAGYARKPRVYIVGRSQEAADVILQHCRQQNPGGQFTFIKADVSLMENVDHVCSQIKQHESTINILFMSQGSMGFNITTFEGLALPSALSIYSRTRFILNLLPLLQKASSLRRVVNVGAATCEGPIDLANLNGEGLRLRQWRDQVASVTTLLLEEEARRAPEVSFVHDVPGIVKGGITRDAEGFALNLIIGISKLLSPLIETPPAECAERHVFFATSAMYPPGKGGGAAGVPLQSSCVIASGTDGRAGGGVYSVDNKNEGTPARVVEVLTSFRKDGTASKLWELVTEHFKAVTGSGH